MGKVLEFRPNKQIEERDSEERLESIRRSLNKISRLMADLKENKDD